MGRRPVPLVLDELIVVGDVSATQQANGEKLFDKVEAVRRNEVPVHGTFIEFGRPGVGDARGSGTSPCSLSTAPAALGLSICVSLWCTTPAADSSQAVAPSAGAPCGNPNAVIYRFSPRSRKAAGLRTHEDRQKERCLTSWRDLCNGTHIKAVREEPQEETFVENWNGYGVKSCSRPQCASQHGSGLALTARESEGVHTSTDDEGESSDDYDEDDQDNLPQYSENAELPSVGSALHGQGGCKRCCFFPKGRCANGVDCQFCHFAHEKRKAKGKKKNKKRRRTRRQTEARFAHSQQLQLHYQQEQRQEDFLIPEVKMLAPVVIHELEPAQSMMAHFMGY